MESRWLSRSRDGRLEVSRETSHLPSRAARGQSGDVQLSALTKFESGSLNMDALLSVVQKYTYKGMNIGQYESTITMYRETLLPYHRGSERTSCEGLG